MSELKCPHCNKPITLADISSEAFKDLANIDIDEKVQSQLESVRKQTLDQFKKDSLSREKTYEKKLEEAKEKLESIEYEREKERKSLEKELIKANDKQMEKLQDDFYKKEKETKENSKNALRNLENKLNEMEGLHALEKARYEKKVQDLAAGSGGDGELKGEAFEEKVKITVKQEFPEFNVEDVSKGQKGADLIITSFRGAKILIEAKNTKTWGGSWVNKLKDDINREDADFGIIVTSGVMPPDANQRKYIPAGQKVSICEFSNFLPALRIRVELVEIVKDQELKLQGSNDKKDQLYAFVNSTRFTNSVDTIMESLEAQSTQLIKEENSARKLFEQRKILNNKVMDNFYSAFKVQIQSYILEPGNVDENLIDESIDIDNDESKDLND
jgi:hypothetical protein